jgi:uncharacterized protein (DUF1697 family)
MPRYAVLLRGINVGKAKRVAMADLRALLADLGYTAVRTHLNSGNAVVTGPEADETTQADTIAAAVVERTGVEAKVVVLSQAQLRTIIDGHPFADTMESEAKGGSRMMANVLGAEPSAEALAAYDPTSIDPEFSRMGERVIYQWCADGVLESPPVGVQAEKKLGVIVTARNWNTVTKLAELLAAE